jgi:cation transport regulator ChaC
MEEKIQEGFLKPALSLICPHCEKSHKISVDIKVKITECTKCAKKIKIPDNLEEMDKLVNNLHNMEVVNKELINLKKLAIAQEEEIKVLKEGKQYIGLLPSNFRKLDDIVRKLQEAMDHVQEDINKCFEPNTSANAEHEDTGSSEGQPSEEESNAEN